MSDIKASPVNLAHRLGSLTAALKNLETHPDTEPAARQLVALMRASGEIREMTELALVALQAEQCTSGEFRGRLRNLISIVKEQIVLQESITSPVLVVSSDVTLSYPLQVSLKQRHYDVTVVDSARKALAFIDANPVAFCIIDVVLPDMDGRLLIADLRAKPATAAMPIIMISPRGISDISARNTQQEGSFEKPVNPADIADYLSIRLKRGHVKGHEARRDTGTGLLNRAACHESYARLQAIGTTPIAFAIFGIQRFSTLTTQCTPEAVNTLIRQIGSLLSSNLRSTDIVARWNISEFAVTLSNEDHYGATKAAEKLLATLNPLTIETPSGKTIPVTVCGGVTVASRTLHIEDVAMVAERHLYAAFQNEDPLSPNHRLISDTDTVTRRNELIALFLADANITRGIRKLLQNETFQVEVYSDLGAARRGLAQAPVDLLIVDDELPDGQGFKILSEVKDYPSQRNMRIMMMASHEASIEQVAKLGVDDYILKPPPIPSFLTQVRRVLWRESSTPSRFRTTILVLDHELPQLLLAGTALHQLGACHVLLARGPADALQRLESTQPDYVILNIDMPDMTANEFLQQIPNPDRLKNMSLILSSGAPIAPLPNLRSFPVLGTISRPFKPTDFIREIRSLIPSIENAPPSKPTLDPAPLESEIQRILMLRT